MSSIESPQEAVLGAITPNGDLQCGACTHRCGKNQGAQGRLRVKCHGCNRINLFDLPINEHPLQRLSAEQLHYLQAVETTDLCLAESLRDLVTAFRDQVVTVRGFLDDRRARRLVAV